MKSWKGYIAVFLLAILSVSVIPKELWHECDHAHTEGGQQAGSVEVGMGCLVCDYNFSAANVGKALVFRDAVLPDSALSVFCPDPVFPLSLPAQPLRGPPHC